MKFSNVKQWMAAATIALLPSLASAAPIEAGKVYQFVNVGYPEIALTSNGSSSASGATAKASDLTQLWQVTAATPEGYFLRNLFNGMYLKSSHGRSAAWSCSTVPSTTDCAMNISTRSDGNLLIRAVGDTDPFTYAHCDQQNVIVGWSVDTAPTLWTAEPTTLSDAEITAALNRADAINSSALQVSAYQTALDAIFTDGSCTELKPAYQGMSATALTADANYKALPAALQQMVQKVKSGNWAEECPNSTKWDSEHAKKFRVQSYEPFSRGAEAAQMLGVQSYTNMNGPTGIIASSFDVLYVMVDKAPKEGATLYMGSAIGDGMFNYWDNGVELHQGLNIVPIWTDEAIQFIYYTVDTYDTAAKTRKHKLSDFEDLTIHIEGGSVNGFFNYIGDRLYTPDTNADWNYYRTRATHTMFDLVGEYVILHFFLHDVIPNPAGGGTDTTPGLKNVLGPNATFDLPTIMKAWDDMCFTERLTIGAQSDADIVSERARGYYGPLTGDTYAGKRASAHEYFNNRMMGITMQGSLFMNATTWRTAYNPTTMRDILIGLPVNSGSLWGPAHEYGHINQTPMKIAGTTEISNNVFSNVAVFYQGLTTSRAELPSSMRNVFNRNQTYLENGIWGCTRMYLQLWLYYHYLGHNKQFYPRLYQLLCDNPRQQSYYLNPRYDALHFAKMCCIAAQEDLTDFFTAWGFFVPLDNYHIGDYAEWWATLTQADIDAVKKEIADMNLPKNRAMILIDDRPGSDRPSWADYFGKELCGALGGLKDFSAGTKSNGKYLYSISGLGMNVTGGEGGVGFIGFDADDNIITFANDYAWEMNLKAASLLATGQAKLYAVNADNTLTEVPSALTQGTAQQKEDMLKGTIEAARKLIALKDETESKVSWYRAPALAALEAAVEAATNARSEAEIVAAYTTLAAEYYGLLANDDARVKVKEGYGYHIVNCMYTNKALAVDASKGDLSTLAPNTDNDKQIWLLTSATDGSGMYYLRNKANGKYISAVEKNNVIIPTSEVPVPYSFIEMGEGRLAIAANNDEGTNSLNLSPSGSVVRWSSGDLNSQWIVTEVGRDETPELLENLANLVERVDNLVKEAGTVNVENTPIELTTSLLSTNAGGNEQYGNLALLVDKNTRNFFQSGTELDDDNNPVSDLDHYIDIDVSKSRSNIGSFTYTLRYNSTPRAPKRIVVYGSVSTTGTKVWEHVATIGTGLPSKNKAVYVSDPLIYAKAYRHIRLMVTDTWSGSADHGHASFILAELGMNKTALTAEAAEQFPGVTEAILLDAYKKMLTGRGLLEADATSSQLKSAYEALAEAHRVLLAAMDRTGLSDITTDAAQTEGTEIYDLSGRKLQSITTPGIYIVNGEKVVVK